jgi:hypothetical protein
VAHQQMQSVCSTCKRMTLHARDTYEVRHLAHLILTICTCGFWLIIWGIHTLANSFSLTPFLCQVCGTRKGTPSSEELAARSKEKSKTAEAIGAAIGRATAKIGTMTGLLAVALGQWIWAVLRNAPGKVDLWLKSTAGEGNDLIYRFFQFWAIALSASIGFGILALLWLSSWLWLSIPFYLVLAGVALLALGGKTIERRRANGSGIAVVGLVMLFIGLPLTVLRILESPSIARQGSDVRQSSQQTGDQSSSVDRQPSTVAVNGRSNATAGYEPDEFAPHRAKRYELVNTRGMLFRVYVPREFAHDLAVYQEACRELSAGRDFTSIGFWDDRSEIPSADEPIMTDEQLDAEVAMYVKNVSKDFNLFQWLQKGEPTDVGPVH